MYQVVLPELGEGIQSAMVAYWHFKQGDVIKKDSELVELVTDKASFNITSDQEGVLKSIMVNEGEEAKVGQILAVIE